MGWGVVSVVAAAAEADGFLDCILRNTGDGKEEEDCTAAVGYCCFLVDLEDSLLVLECIEIGASQAVSPDGSYIAGNPVIPEVGNAAGVKEYSCAHVDAEVAPGDKDRLGPGQETFPARPKFVCCIWSQKIHCRDFFYQYFRHFVRCTEMPSGRSGYLTAFPQSRVDRKLHFLQTFEQCLRDG